MPNRGFLGLQGCMEVSFTVCMKCEVEPQLKISAALGFRNIIAFTLPPASVL
jgi:hypothetical protein